MKEKKEWKMPVVKKVELTFDKEMASNCHASSNPSFSNGKGCGPQSSGTCWTNRKS